jgi:3'-5' exoribonuclease
MTLQEILRQDGEGTPERREIPVQLEAVRPGRTQQQKPFFDLELVDATGRAKIKIWSDTAAFEFCEGLKGGECCQLEGAFFVNQYGLNVNNPKLRLLTEAEKADFLAGTPGQREKQEADWQHLLSIFEGLEDARLRAVTTGCLTQLEKKWRRAAAARTYHHARRGGLVEHTAQMLRCAQALAPLYPEVTPGLLYCGVLFHDVGKLWENDYDGDSFISLPNRRGELLGHISLGIEVVNRFWREAEEKQPELFKEATPPSDLLRDHLLHLIASHHGSREFGSPVTPRTPEGWLLHHIDNIDAKIEMLRCTYAEKKEVAPGLYEIRRPLEGSAAAPLSKFED